jgi:hypothetical protein
MAPAERPAPTPPGSEIRNFFFLGILGLPFIHLTIIGTNFNRVYRSRLHRNLARKQAAQLPMSALDHACVSVLGPPPADTAEVVIDTAACFWVDMCAGGMLFWLVVLVWWLNYAQGKENLYVRTVPSNELSSW